MEYAVYVAEVAKFEAAFSQMTLDEKYAHPVGGWLQLIADVTCETPGCPHGTVRVSFTELCNDSYSAHCGNCDKQIKNIVGIFDDRTVVMKPTVHEITDPWDINAAM